MFLFLTGCAAGEGVRNYTPPSPPNVVIAGAIDAAPGHELVMGDNLFPAGAVIAAHSHPGEEFILVQAGSVTLTIEGQDDQVLGPGDALRIPPETVHSAVAGPDGARAISNWIKPNDAPLRVPAPTEGESE